jgi:hypothetical protein
MRGVGPSFGEDNLRPNHALQRTAAPLLRSERGGNLDAPRALHRPCRRRSLSLGR